MSSWRACLDAAGVRGRTERADFSAALRYSRRTQFAAWASVRALMPPRIQPHVLAAEAVALYTDNLCDRGPAGERRQRFEEWSGEVAAALQTGRSEHRLLRTYLHSSEALSLPRQWIDAYLAGTRIDLDFPGFAGEADFQRYVDTVSLPALMFGIASVPRLVPEECFLSSVRLVAQGTQRTDNLTDLFEDLRNGRLALPVCDLDRHGVTRTDLERGRDTPGVRALLEATAGNARASLDAGQRMLGEIPPENRPFFRFLIDVFHQRLDDVAKQGPALIGRRYRDTPVACLRLLIRSHRAGASTSPHPGHTAGRA
ncbi:squalene/phytoene synthase family protein [Streptomyces melanogenes]|uniref:squalene/phytoene synthase family protein n=1 Tax=Streptomyces melanogenes TaxID=67326 RepID=UPI003791DB5C